MASRGGGGGGRGSGSRFSGRGSAGWTGASGAAFKLRARRSRRGVSAWEGLESRTGEVLGCATRAHTAAPLTAIASDRASGSREPPTPAQLKRSKRRKLNLNRKAFLLKLLGASKHPPPRHRWVRHQPQAPASGLAAGEGPAPPKQLTIRMQLQTRLSHPSGLRHSRGQSKNGQHQSCSRCPGADNLKALGSERQHKLNSPPVPVQPARLSDDATSPGSLSHPQC